MSDEPINIEAELEAAQARLPVVINNNMPLPFTIRVIALSVAQRHAGDTVVREGNMYQQLKMDGKTFEPMTADHVIRAALIFERYLWGEWSKGIAENAMNAVATEAADAIEAELRERGMSPPAAPEDAP